MNKYIINLESAGLHFSINNVKSLAKNKIAKFIRSEKNKTLEQHKQKATNCLEYFDLDFEHIEYQKTTNKTYNLYFAPNTYNKSGVESQVYLLIISKNDSHESYYIDTKDPYLRTNKQVFKALKNQMQYKIIEVPNTNLDSVYIDYDYSSKREYLTACYKSGTKHQIYIQKLFN